MTRVVLVDDHRLVRDGIKWMLVNEPSVEVVGEAGSGEELFELLDEVSPDLLLVDIRMPGMSGLDILTELRDRPGAPRAIVLSMYHEPGLVQQAIAAGAAGYLKKNAGRDELIEAIATVAGGRSYLQGELTQPLVAQLADPAQDPPRFSDQDRTILELMAHGARNKELAETMGLTERDVRAIIERLFDRLDVHSRSEAVAVALRLGVID